MYNKEIIEKFYNQDKEKFETIYKTLKSTFPEEQGLLKEAEQIVNVLISLKLDINSICVGLIFPFAKKYENYFARFMTIIKCDFVFPWTHENRGVCLMH